MLRIYHIVTLYLAGSVYFYVPLTVSHSHFVSRLISQPLSFEVHTSSAAPSHHPRSILPHIIVLSLRTSLPAHTSPCTETSCLSNKTVLSVDYMLPPLSATPQRYNINPTRELYRLGERPCHLQGSDLRRIRRCTRLRPSELSGCPRQIA